MPIDISSHAASFWSRRSAGSRLSTYQDLEQVVVGNVGQLRAVEFGDHELFGSRVSFLSTLAVVMVQVGCYMRSLQARPVPEKSRHSKPARSSNEVPTRAPMRGRTRRREAETHRMATAERLDIEKGKDLVALKQLEGRDVPCQPRRSMLADRLNGCDDEAGWDTGIGGMVHSSPWPDGVGERGGLPLMILQKMQAAEDMVNVALLGCSIGRGNG